jgi:hypothetical protein
MNWKRVNKKNYDSFSSDIYCYQFVRDAATMLVESNGMLTVWDDEFEKEFSSKDFRFDNEIQYFLDYRSSKIVGTFYAV